MTPYSDPATIAPQERQSSTPGAGRRRARVLVPAVLVVIWLALTALGGQTFANLSNVVTNDQASFLPAEAESTRALELQEQFGNGETVPAVIVASLQDAELTSEDMTAAQDLADDAAEISGVTEVLPPQPSEDSQALQMTALLEDDDAESLQQLRELVAVSFEDGIWQAHVAGPAAYSADLAEAFAGVDGLLLLVALVVVLIILVAVYRSALLPFLVLLSSMGALCAAITVTYLMAQAQWIQLNGQVQGILSILVIGAATNYSLLLVARYREELAVREDWRQGLLVAVRRTAPPVLASGTTVALALLCLLASDLNSNTALGPVAAAGIVFSMTATLTFLPAMLMLVGRAGFWPRIPRPAPGATVAEAEVSARGKDYLLWRRVAAAVRARPRVVWVAVTLLLLVCAAGVPQLRADGVPQSDFVLGETETKMGQELLETHFEAGTGSPANVFLDEAVSSDALELITETDGVADAYLVGDGGAPAQGPDEAAEVAGMVQVAATLDTPGDSQAAEETVAELRSVLSEQFDGETLVGGTTATQLDTNETAQQDLQVIVPLVLLVITVILIIVLRSLVTPLILLSTTALSYLAALGISALVFNEVFEFPGADPSVPLFGFIFLVALGVDYNIFLMTRAREETPKLGTAAGVLRSLVVTGGVITSAGVVLAATFMALAVLPLMFMVQLAFLVAVGVFIDTFIVRTLQVPAMIVDLGRTAWWPSQLHRKEKRERPADLADAAPAHGGDAANAAAAPAPAAYPESPAVMPSR